MGSPLTTLLPEKHCKPVFHCPLLRNRTRFPQTLASQGLWTHNGKREREWEWESRTLLHKEEGSELQEPLVWWSLPLGEKSYGSFKQEKSWRVGDGEQGGWLPVLASWASPDIQRKEEEQRPFPFIYPLSDQHISKPSPTLTVALRKASWFHPAAHPREPMGPGDRDTGEDSPPSPYSKVVIIAWFPPTSSLQGHLRIF